MYFECRNHAQILCVHIHNFYCRKKNVEFQSWKQNFSFPTMLRTFHAKSNAQFKVVCSAADNFFSMKKMEFSILEAELSPLFVILRSEFIFFPAMKSCKKNIFIFNVFKYVTSMRNTRIQSTFGYNFQKNAIDKGKTFSNYFDWRNN